MDASLSDGVDGVRGNREVPPQSTHGAPTCAARPCGWEEGGPWGKHGFPHGSEPEASDAAGFVEIAALESELVAARERRFARA
jgi:hypothetical protein